MSAARLPLAPQRPGPSRLLANIGVLAGGQVVTWSLTFLWTLFVPRLLGPRGMGLLVTYWSASGLLVVVVGLGTSFLLVREIAADRSRAPGLLGTTFVLRAALALPVLGLSGLFVHLSRFNGDQRVVVYVAAASAIALLFVQPMQSTFQAVERMEYLALYDVLNKALLTVCGIVMVLLGFRALSLVVLACAVQVIALALNAWWLRSQVTIDWRVDLARLTSLVRGSLAYWAYGLFFTFYLWIDSLMLSVMTPPTVVGWYGAPTRIFNTLMFLPTILLVAWFPRMAAAFGESPEQLEETARRPLELVVILSLPIGVGAALTARPVMSSLYGPSFLPAVPVFAILALTVIPMYLNIVVASILTASSGRATWAKVMAGAALLNPAMNFVLIRYFQDHAQNGAIGAAISMLVTEGLIGLVALYVARRYLKTVSIGRIVRATAATAGMAALVLLTRRFGVVTSIGAGAATFVGLSAALGVITAEELRELSALAARLDVRAQLRRFRQAPRSS